MSLIDKYMETKVIVHFMNSNSAKGSEGKIVGQEASLLQILFDEEKEPRLVPWLAIQTIEKKDDDGLHNSSL